MTHKVILAPQARHDLIELYEYIADKADPIRAKKYKDRIEASCQSLSTFPARGLRRDDLEPGLRIIGFERRITITFHIEGKAVIIGRVLYGGRSLEKVFRKDE